MSELEQRLNFGLKRVYNLNMQNTNQPKSFVTTDEEIIALRERNAARAKVMIESLGSRYLCHPSNKIKKNNNAPTGRLSQTSFV